MNTIERIKTLSDMFGPSGFEDRVAAFVTELLKDYAPETDAMRNVRVEKEKNSEKPRVMLDAHMDEVGAIVQAVMPSGAMRFLPVGGWSMSSFPSSSFSICTKNGDLVKAVVAAKPPHFMNESERNRLPAIADMILDCGTTSKEETEALGIGIGSPAVPDVACQYDEARGLFYGKAFDDRIGVAAMIEILQELKDEDLPCNILGSFSTQEEVGERGVRINSRNLRPDVAICFEGCPADDTFQQGCMIQTALKKGPMLRHIDRSMITNWRFQKFALETAHANNIPVQEAVRSGGGTNGASINMQEGVPAIVIGVPVRYIHSHHCWCSLEDYQNAVKLGLALCRSLTPEIIAGL